MKRIGELLVEAGAATEVQVAKALSLQPQRGKRLGQVMVELGMVTDSDVARALARQQGLEFVQLSGRGPQDFVTGLLTKEMVQRHGLVPLERCKQGLKVAMADPLDLEALKEVEFTSGLRAVPVVAGVADILDALQRCYCVEAKAPGTPPEGIEENPELVIEKAPRLNTLEADASSESVVPLVNAILANAVYQRASDIHLEPQEASLLTRYRIDGLLSDVLIVPKALQDSLLSRIKILSNLDIAERRKPQDGRIRLRVDQSEVDLRVSTLPALYGERIVIRVLEKSMATISLDRLGLLPEDCQVLRELLQRTQGMILVTGPTGSGKTTTLYACLNHIKYFTKNIITVEDPVEYRIPGINQVPVNEKAGVTFASGLRSILRQDPNIIMLGEIRDHETAEIALRASLTGHLVLSTMHTNDAPSAVTRLLDIGIESHLIASTLAGVLAQRLVRRVCPSCQEAYEPDEALLGTLGLSRGLAEGRKFKRGKGCEACHHTGHSGRLGVFEVLRVGERLKELVAKRASEQDLLLAAKETGMRTLEEDGLVKLLSGLTSVEEVLRVVPPRYGSKDIRIPEPAPPAEEEEGPAVLEEPGKRQAPVNLPEMGSVRAPAIEIQDLPNAREKPALAKDRVLVVEDDSGIREMLAAFLVAEHYDVATAGDGEEALERVYERTPDLVITDVMMPRLDGFGLCRRLRSHRATCGIPIIVLTSRTEVESEVEGLELGADDYIPKPIEPRRLLARMRRLLIEASR
jgi:type IV pilus assembly protein PilB